jgi:uncharacterized protein GlcG (DUF336 family)
MRNNFFLTLATAFAIVPLGRAAAQIAESGYPLPADFSAEGRGPAIASRRSGGYPVSAVLIDASSLIKIEARGDHATAHIPNAGISQGVHGGNLRADLPIQRVEGVCAARRQEPQGAALATLTDIAPLKAGDEIIAALSVSGSPGGDKDEPCAQAGVASIPTDLANSLAHVR